MNVSFCCVFFQSKPVEETIDLLNLSSLNLVSTNASSAELPTTNFDLLSRLNDNVSTAFEDFVSSATPTTNMTSENENTKSTVISDLFDPFGASNMQADFLGEWEYKNTVEKPQKPNNLFAELGMY